MSADMAFAALVDVIADAVAARLRQPAAVTDEPRYYSAETAPMGPRAFLDAVRRGAFPAYRPGKVVLAKRADVHAWIEAHPRKMTATDGQPTTTDEDDELLASTGYVPKQPAPTKRG